MTSPQ